MLGRVTSGCNNFTSTFMRIVYYFVSCLVTCCDPAVPSSPVYDASTDAKCTVERQGSRDLYYAVLAMPVSRVTHSITV